MEGRNDSQTIRPGGGRAAWLVGHVLAKRSSARRRHAEYSGRVKRMPSPRDIPMDPFEKR